MTGARKIGCFIIRAKLKAVSRNLLNEVLRNVLCKFSSMA
ncbi:Hypothetical protein F387_01231 [Wohlfahrtiimonas chitiniclastica SH04]|uniref:Uncharacterized protein n=1 Tax=Wohlfahrtiimonas chitiniclastica SH04 TaxID=1261130 RepID=L8XZL9_9GAMM|nr:Hypothetical protein F387_01231 [Wohlfahrtiimonas chitiniclastica SH04]